MSSEAELAIRSRCSSSTAALEHLVGDLGDELGLAGADHGGGARRRLGLGG